MSSADTATTEAPEGSPEADAPVIDPKVQALLDTLTAELGDDVVDSDTGGGDLVVRVRAGAWRRAGEVCRDRLGMDYFSFLSGLDWMPSAPNPEEAAAETDVEDADADEAPDADSAAQAEKEYESDPGPMPAGSTATTTTAAGEDEAAAGEDEGWETGVAGGETRFQVFARLHSTTRGVGLTLKADLDDDEPRVETWTPVYRGADWHERETWEMYGFDFVGHPHLAHLYLPAEFEGHPLRKDFPLLSREVKPWPGLVDVEIMPAHLEAAAEAAVSGGAAAEAAVTGGGSTDGGSGASGASGEEPA